MQPKSNRPLSIENEWVRFSLLPASHSWLLEDVRAGERVFHIIGDDLKAAR